MQEPSLGAAAAAAVADALAADALGPPASAAQIQMGILMP